ncbi:MAG: hypothetical protein RSD07_12865, partial [Angelakisella sp.]
MTTTAAAEVEGVAPGGKLDTTPLTQAAVDEVFGKGSATLSGTTITLNKNVVSYGDYTDNIQLNVDCTLDLAGHTLRQDAGALTFNQSEGALAIRGNSTVKIVGGGLVKGGTDKRGTGRPAITTKDTSTLVIGEGVTVAGGDGKSNPPGGHEYTEGGDAIDMFGTEVTVYGIVKGGDSESHPTAPSNCYGGRGIHVRYSSIGSAVTVAEGGKVFGGKGADSSNGGYAGTGGSGIALEQGSECTVTVKGSVTGGAGGNNTSNDKTGGTGGDAVAIYGSSDLIVSVGGSVTGGNGGDSSSSRVAQNGGTGGNGIRTGSQPCSIQLDGTATGGKGGSCSGGGFAGKGGKGIYLQRGNNNIQ